MSLTPDIERVLAEHRIECTGLGEVSCAGCRDRGWMSWHEYRAHLADHLAALLGQHVEAAKREAWEDGYLACQDGKQQQADNPYRAGGGAAGGGES